MNRTLGAYLTCLYNAYQHKQLYYVNKFVF